MAEPSKDYGDILNPGLEYTYGQAVMCHTYGSQYQYMAFPF